MLQSMKTLRLSKKSLPLAPDIPSPHNDSLNFDKDIPDDIILVIVEYLSMTEVLKLCLVVSVIIKI